MILGIREGLAGKGKAMSERNAAAGSVSVNNDQCHDTHMFSMDRLFTLI